MDDNFVQSAPTLPQLRQAEAIALALAEFTLGRRAAKLANQDAPASGAITVQTHAGIVQVKLTLTSAPPAATAKKSSGKPARARAASTKKKRKY